MISVIVPVYNVEKYLERCLNSLINQTFKDFEIILIDDGSTDESPRICDEIALKYDFIIVLHQSNRGQAFARNRGIEKAKGDYIAFVDSDDFVHPDYLNLLYSAITQANADIAICDFKRFTQESEIKVEKEEIREISEYDNYTIFKTDNNFFDAVDNFKKGVLWNKLYKKEQFSEIKFPEGEIHEDTATYYKFLYLSRKTVYINNALYFYYDNPVGTMGKPFTEKRLNEFFFFFEQAVFFEKIALQDERYASFSREVYKNAVVTFYWRAKNNPSFDFKNNEKAKRIKKRLKPFIKETFPFGCANIEFYEFYFGKHNPLLRIRYFFYKMKRRFRIKTLKKDG